MGFQSSGICGSLANVLVMADDRGTKPKRTKVPDEVGDANIPWE